MFRSIALFKSPEPVPAQHQRNFNHLYWDVAWWGLLQGSASTFLTVYATRLGASGWHLGVLSAIPALVSLLVTLPSGQFLEGKPVDRTVFWTAVANRIFYLALIPLPWLFSPEAQIWAIIAICLLMTIPGTAVGIGFNAMFAEAVPSEWRGHVMGIRTALNASVCMITTLACGWVLSHMPFPAGYQVVFALGLAGAALSSYHLYRIQVAPRQAAPQPVEPPHPRVRASKRSPFAAGFVHAGSLRLADLLLNHPTFRLDILRGRYGRLLALIIFFQLAMTLPVPVFPMYYVRVMNLPDQVLGLGSAVSNLLIFLTSTQFARITRRWSNKRVTGAGVILMGIFPVAIALLPTIPVYVLANVVGGFAWALVGSAMFNYLLDSIPENDRPSHLAWHSLAVNGAVMVGSMLGPMLAGQLELHNALILYAALRVLSGLAILKLG